MTPKIGSNTGIAPDEPSTSFAKDQTERNHRMNVHKLPEQIETIRRLLAASKPRSRRRIELELQLRDIVTKQLRVECRNGRRVA